MNEEGDAEKPQFEWVAVEHRDADGNRTFPQDLIAGTYLRRYEEVPDDTEIKVLVLVDYKPKALMLVERKIYEIHRLATHGWRQSGQIVVEMDGWRQHEAGWFEAMQGARLEIPDPNVPLSRQRQSDYIISGTAFQRKIVTLVGEDGGKTELKMYEGTLLFRETWTSAWRRQAAEVLNLGFKYFLLPGVSALVAGLAVWWIERPPEPVGQDTTGRAGAAEQRVKAGMDNSVPQPSDQAAGDLRPKGRSKEADTDGKNVTESAPSEDLATEVSESNRVEGQSQSDTNAVNPSIEGDTPELPAPADAKQGQVYKRQSADNE